MKADHMSLLRELSGMAVRGLIEEHPHVHPNRVVDDTFVLDGQMFAMIQLRMTTAGAKQDFVHGMCALHNRDHLAACGPYVQGTAVLLNNRNGTVTAHSSLAGSSTEISVEQHGGNLSVDHMGNNHTCLVKKTVRWATRGMQGNNNVKNKGGNLLVRALIYSRFRVWLAGNDKHGGRVEHDMGIQVSMYYAFLKTLDQVYRGRSLRC